MTDSFRSLRLVHVLSGTNSSWLSLQEYFLQGSYTELRRELLIYLSLTVFVRPTWNRPN